jgi:hypothetical protein
MGKLRCIFRREKIGLIMALQALILRNVTISFIVPDVALETTHSPFDVSLVVEAYPLDQDIALWLYMARTTEPHSAQERQSSVPSVPAL